MSNDRRTGSDHRDETRSASGGETLAPDAPADGFVRGNDPTDGSNWIRRSLRVAGAANSTNLDEAVNVILDLPGVARARRSADAGITIDMRPDLLSDQELQGALERAALSVEAWTDEPLSIDDPSGNR